MDDRFHRTESEQKGADRKPAGAINRGGAREYPDEVRSLSSEEDDTREFLDEVVRGGYNVVNEYIDQAMRLAQITQRSMRRSINSTYGMADRGSWQMARTQERWMDNSLNLMEMWFRYWDAGSGYWSDMVDVMGSGGRPSRAKRRSPPMEAKPAPQASEPVTPQDVPRIVFEYEVQTGRPATVFVDLHPGRETTDLFCMDLRCFDHPDAPPIPARFSYIPASDRVRVSLVVKDDQPSGKYTSVLLGGGNEIAVGTIELTLN